jgi:hypothetical protein
LRPRAALRLLRASRRSDDDLAAFAAPFIAADDTLPVVVASMRGTIMYLQVFGPGGRTLVAPASHRCVRPCVFPQPAYRASLEPRRQARSAVAAGERPPTKVEQRSAPDINWVARLGAAATDTGTPPKPLYLRPPDAHPQEAVQLARR